jgi:signal transduction histidine kinase/large-conductance mechanosensitive channel
MNSKVLFKYGIFFSLFIGFIIIATQSIIEDVKKDNYLKEVKNLHNQLQTLIDEKQSTTKIIAVSLSQNESIQDAIVTNKPELVKLKELSKNYNLNTNFKNVWLHIVTNEGISFKRSWVKKRGDSILKVRMDIPPMLKNPKIKSHISTGKFDLTFKAMVPIYRDDKFIGIFEVITHFNSISKILAKSDIDSVYLVDKSYKKQLTKAFTKMFVNDYYVANFDAPKEIRDYLAKDKNIVKISNKDIKYYIDKKNDRFFTVYHLPDIKGKNMAYMFMSKKLSLIPHDNIISLRITQLSLILFGLLTFILILLYNRVRKKENDLINKNTLLKEQKLKTQKIFDSGPAITILTDGKELRDANKEFFDFFGYDSLDEFKKDHFCICDYFEKYHDESYIQDKEIDNKPWTDYLMKHSEKIHKVMMKKDNKEYHFVVIANESNIIEEDSDHLIVVSFIDTTQEVELLKDIREKDRILVEQSKMISMGEMLGNIAHQWRQPLSVISTVSTGLMMKIEYNSFKKEDAIKSLDTLNKNAQYLSHTIDDFRNFFNQKIEKNIFDLNKLIKQDLTLIDASLKNNNIDIAFDSNKEEIQISSYENKLTQALLNIITNAKDALSEQTNENKIIQIKTTQNKEHIKISIKDNGGGIKEDIKDRIYEPYFTTKHQSQGTGIGLYMTNQIITKHLNGSIDMVNVDFEYEGVDCTGAEFIITLPVN